MVAIDYTDQGLLHVGENPFRIAIFGFPLSSDKSLVYVLLSGSFPHPKLLLSPLVIRYRLEQKQRTGSSNS